MTVRVWEPKKMVAISQKLTHDATAMDWSQDGTFIVIGDRNGVAHLMDAEKLTILGSHKSALAGKKAAWVEDIKISPDCQMIAFGTHGGRSKIDLARVTAQKKLTKLASV